MESGELAVRYLVGIVSLWLFLGTTYYVKKGGSDGNSGTDLGNAWLTVNHDLEPGDTVLVYDDGGALTDPWTFHSGSDGAYGNPIVYMAGPGEDPYFSLDLTTHAINGNGKDHWVIQDIDAHTVDMFFNGNVAQYLDVTIQQCSVYNAGNHPVVQFGQEVLRGTFRYNWIDRADTAGKSGVEAGNGDIFTFWANADSILIEYNHLTRCNHQPVNLYTNPDYFIIRHNEGPYSHTLIGGINERGRMGLIEFNFGHHPGSYLNDGVFTQAMGLFPSASNVLIIRGETLRDDTVNTSNTQEGLVNLLVEDENQDSLEAWVSGVRMSYCTIDGTNDASYNKDIVNIVNQSYAKSHANNKNDNNAFFNNIFINPSNNHYVFRDRDEQETDNNWFNNQYRNNLLHKANSNATMWSIENGPGGATYTVSTMESTFPTLCSGNKDTLAGLADPANYDFTPDTASWAAGNARYLTTATEGDVSSSVMQVADAKWFCDGWGMIQGDSIYFNGTARGIVNVNYSTNMLTISAVATWSTNEQIWYFKDGIVWDDVGAVQLTEESEEPPLPVPPKRWAPIRW